MTQWNIDMIVRRDLKNDVCVTHMNCNVARPVHRNATGAMICISCFARLHKTITLTSKMPCSAFNFSATLGSTSRSTPKIISASFSAGLSSV